MEESIMVMLTKNIYPGYSENEIWDCIEQYCMRNRRKFELYVHYYIYVPNTENFGMHISAIERLIGEASNRQIQLLLRELTNFETGMLILMCQRKLREKVFENLSRRLTMIIQGEAYVISKKIDLNDDMFEKIVSKIQGIYQLQHEIRGVINVY